MKKVLKTVLKLLVIIPVSVVTLIIGFEIFGAVFNSASTAAQTAKAKREIKELFPDAVITDTYSETGNTSGTGNHVDMLSIIVFQTDGSAEQIEKLREEFALDEWSCWIEKKTTIEELRKKHGFSAYDSIDFPENIDNCYIFYLCKSAPFSDNIMGH